MGAELEVFPDLAQASIDLEEFPLLVERSELLPEPTPNWPELVWFAAEQGTPAASATERAFLAEILKHPEDPVPRSVYADWLEEQGDPRGDWIREQLEREADLSGYQMLLDFILAQGVLTPWQCDRLLRGVWRGFWVDEFRLLRILRRFALSADFLADTGTGSESYRLEIFDYRRDSFQPQAERFGELVAGLIAIEHPNLVELLEGRIGDRYPYFIWEHCDGVTLSEWVHAVGALPYELAAHFIKHAAEGLAAAHAGRRVHGEVTPSKILATRTGRVKLLDLGCSYWRHLGLQDYYGCTPFHDFDRIQNAADYLSPEQIGDSPLVDHRTDIYGLGCNFYFLLAGRPPFPEGTVAQRAMAHATKLPTPISELRPQVPAEFEQIHARMCAKRPVDRYQSMTEVTNNLAAWLTSRAEDKAAAHDTA